MTAAAGLRERLEKMGRDFAGDVYAGAYGQHTPDECVALALAAAREALGEIATFASLQGPQDEGHYECCSVCAGAATEIESKARRLCFALSAALSAPKEGA